VAIHAAVQWRTVTQKLVIYFVRQMSSWNMEVRRHIAFTASYMRTFLILIHFNFIRRRVKLLSATASYSEGL